MAALRHIIVVGGGVFGLAASIELAARHNRVTVIEAGEIPAAQASSTDISKILRMDYGADTLYASMMLEAFERWDRWNETWGVDVFHRDGFLLLTRDRIRPGSLEFDSLAVQEQMGLQSERVTPAILRERYPAWNAERYLDGYFNAKAGWSESGLVVTLLRRDAEAAGVTILEKTRVSKLLYKSSRVIGVQSEGGTAYQADVVVLAAGTWTRLLSENLGRVIRHTAQPVFHFRPSCPELFHSSRFPVWSADMGKTGFYGFPLHRQGVVKVANHGPGREAHPDSAVSTTPEDEQFFRTFLEESLPALADAPVAASKICFYADSWDGDFYIDHDPEHEGLVYATGGSGHGFKFAPVLGEVIADAVDRQPNRYGKRFAWREPDGRVRKEQARHQGDAVAVDSR